MKSQITKAVWILSLVSFFTDLASEMLYPVMPIYLKEIGFSILLIGILEGIAEGVAGLSKGYFGKLSDTRRKRIPFVRLGYSFSAISKPMMAIFTWPLWIFFARTIDRFGKGIRTGARDALLSDEATPETKGKVFGFHRSMDTFGAVFGPLVALVFLHFFPQNYKLLFFVAFIPGVIAIFFTFLIKEQKKTNNIITGEKFSFFSFFKYWKQSPALYRKLVIGLLIFTLINSSDMFLLLKIKEVVNDDKAVIGVYVFYNLIYALFAFPLGIAADKIGLKTMLIIGIFLFSGVYFGMTIATGLYSFMFLFFIYGIYAAATEGISKAWITNVCNKKDTATAIGTYTAFQSIFAMLASSITGVLWYKFGTSAAFVISAIVAALVGIYLIFIPTTEKIITKEE